VAYSIQAPGPHGPGCQITGLPVSCCQLEANAGTVPTSKNQRTIHNAYKCQTSSPTRMKLLPTVVLASSRSMASMYSFIPRKLPISSDSVAAPGFTPADDEVFVLDNFTGLAVTEGLAGRCGLELAVGAVLCVLAGRCGLELAGGAALCGLAFDLPAPDVFESCGFLCFCFRGEEHMSPSSSSDSYSSMSELDALSASSNSTSSNNFLCQLHYDKNHTLTVPSWPSVRPH